MGQFSTQKIDYYRQMIHVALLRIKKLIGRDLGFYLSHYFVYSCGSLSAGVSCGSDSLDAERDSFIAALRIVKLLSISGLYLTDALNYHSAGGISQGETEQPDSRTKDSYSSGNGDGSLNMGPRSLMGIGNTTAPTVCSYDVGAPLGLSVMLR